jgi:hypothetical protein
MPARWTPRFTLVSIFLTTAFVAAVALGAATWVGPQSDGSILIPIGQRLTPAGVHIEVNDRPLGMKLSPAGDVLAVVTGSNLIRGRCTSLTRRPERSSRRSRSATASWASISVPTGERSTSAAAGTTT